MIGVSRPWSSTSSVFSVPVNSSWFAAMQLLSSTPEAFYSRFKEKLDRASPDQGIGKDDLVPDDSRYWDQLVAPSGSAATLAAYLDEVWFTEVDKRLARSRVNAFPMLALTFISSAIVPHSLFANRSTDELVQMVEPCLKFDGHFALLGILEICAKRIKDDARFIALGERALQRLFADVPRLERSCELFAPTFVIATAYLSEHEAFQTRPAFWRRLAAAAHASLIVRACGVSRGDYSNLLALGHCGGRKRLYPVGLRRHD
jgi:hypothetical protein